MKIKYRDSVIIVKDKKERGRGTKYNDDGAGV